MAPSYLQELLEIYQPSPYLGSASKICFKNEEQSRKFTDELRLETFVDNLNKKFKTFLFNQGGAEVSLLFRSPKKTVTTDKLSQTFKFAEISEEFVHKKLKSLKTNKASGLDQLSPRLMKDSSSLIAKPLALIMNYSIAQGSVPLDWKASKVSPLYKGGKAYDMDNYRPISVLCISSKIFERAIHSQLCGFLEKNKLLSPYQCGFRKRYSTELATISLSDSILRSMDQGTLTGSVFIDLKKAFDTVDHDLSIEKLSRYVSELLWFRNYLHDRSQVVQYENSLSPPSRISTGVPQGSVLGPL